MARHVHTTPNPQPPKAAAYRSAPMPETALQMMMATASRTRPRFLTFVSFGAHHARFWSTASFAAPLRRASRRAV